MIIMFQVISTNAFEAFNAYWINRQILLNLNCETVDITESQLTSQDFNAFLYQWMASDNKKIKNVRVKGGLGLRFGFKSLDMPTILHGLPFVQGSPKRQFSSRCCNPYQLSVISSRFSVFHSIGASTEWSTRRVWI